MPCGTDPALRYLRTLQIRVDYEQQRRGRAHSETLFGEIFASTWERLNGNPL